MIYRFLHLQDVNDITIKKIEEKKYDFYRYIVCTVDFLKSISVIH